MCGLGGIVRADAGAPVDPAALRRMSAALRHRGPDGWGMALADGAGFVATRLAIFDIPHGWQPLAGRSSVLVYNGEVYNHYELREELRRDGIEPRTTCDSEVVLHLLERDGLAALDRLNGQFAIAWWQPAERRLTLVRDRFGVRPLHLARLADGSTVFASEAKGLFASGEVTAQPDVGGLADVFTTWGPRPPRTAFQGVQQVRPGGVMVLEHGELVADRLWWRPELAVAEGEADTDELAELLEDAVRLRLRADVPVGTYLSGGLDSSLITALAQQASDHELRTFSIAFRDPHFDERAQQAVVAERLGTLHHAVEVGPADIADAFPDTIFHAETPLIRTAPVPLRLLAQEVRDAGITVVATGEGADELFWGYDLFKEVAVRDLFATDPEAAEALADGLYPYLAGAGRRGPAWRRFLLDAGERGDLLRSHVTRFEATAVVRNFLRPEVAEQLDDPVGRLRASLPDGFGRLSALQRASYLEITTLMEPYLLAAQGDRVAMAHGVEGRFPFLDHRVFAHAAALPAHRKLDIAAGLREKAAVRDVAARLLPAEVADRPKQPYRAPEVAPFFGAGAPDYVEELLAPAALDAVGLFAPERVEGLLRRCRAGKATGIREGMALVGILSTQVWHDRLIASGQARYAEESRDPRIVMEALPA